jgi:hypothetical protein
MKKKPLRGKVAAAMFAKNPDSIRVYLQDLLEPFGVTWPELLADLRAGKLVAEKPDAKTLVEAFNERDIWVTGSALLRWRAAKDLQ